MFLKSLGSKAQRSTATRLSGAPPFTTPFTSLHHNTRKHTRVSSQYHLSFIPTRASRAIPHVQPEVSSSKKGATAPAAGSSSRPPPPPRFNNENSSRPSQYSRPAPMTSTQPVIQSIYDHHLHPPPISGSVQPPKKTKAPKPTKDEELLLKMVPPPPPDDIPIKPGSSLTIGDAEKIATKFVWLVASMLIMSALAKITPNDGTNYLNTLMNLKDDDIKRLRVIDYQHPEISIEKPNYFQWYGARMVYHQLKRFCTIFPFTRPIYISPLFHRLNLYTPAGFNLDQPLACVVSGDVDKIDQDIDNIQRYCIQHCAIISIYLKDLNTVTPRDSIPKSGSIIKNCLNSIWSKFTGRPLWYPYQHLDELFRFDLDEMLLFQETVVDYQDTFGTFFPQIINLEDHIKKCEDANVDPAMPEVITVGTKDDPNEVKWKLKIDPKNHHLQPHFGKLESICDHALDLLNHSLQLIDHDMSDGNDRSRDRKSENTKKNDEAPLTDDTTQQPSFLSQFSSIFRSNDDSNNPTSTSLPAQQEKKFNSVPADKVKGEVNLIQKQAYLQQIILTLAQLTTMRDQLEGIAHTCYNSHTFREAMSTSMFTQRFYSIPTKTKAAIKHELKVFRDKNRESLTLLYDSYNKSHGLRGKKKADPYQKEGLHEMGKDLVVLEKIQEICERYSIYWPFTPYNTFFLHQKETFPVRSAQLLQAYREKFMEKAIGAGFDDDEIAANTFSPSTKSRRNPNTPPQALSNALELVANPINRQFRAYFPSRLTPRQPQVKFGLKPSDVWLPNLYYNEDYRHEFDHYISHRLLALMTGSSSSRLAKVNSDVRERKTKQLNLDFAKNSLGDVTTFNNTGESAPVGSLIRDSHRIPIVYALVDMKEFKPFDFALSGVYNETSVNTKIAFESLGIVPNGSGGITNGQDGITGSNDNLHPHRQSVHQPKGLLGLNLVPGMMNEAKQLSADAGENGATDDLNAPLDVMNPFNHADYPIDKYSSLLLRQRIVHLANPNYSRGGNKNNNNNNNNNKNNNIDTTSVTLPVHIAPTLYGPIGLENMLTMRHMPVLQAEDFLILLMSLYERKTISDERKAKQRRNQQHSETQQYIPQTQPDAHRASLRGLNDAGSGGEMGPRAGGRSGNVPPGPGQGPGQGDVERRGSIFGGPRKKHPGRRRAEEESAQSLPDNSPFQFQGADRKQRY